MRDYYTKSLECTEVITDNTAEGESISFTGTGGHETLAVTYNGEPDHEILVAILYAPTTHQP